MDGDGIEEFFEVNRVGSGGSGGHNTSKEEKYRTLTCQQIGF